MTHSHDTNFEEFFTSGLEESISPFLTPTSRKWARNLPLRAALLSAFFLFIAYISSLFHKDLSNLFLVSVFFLSGTPAILNTIEDLKEFEINIDILMTLAAFLSILIGSQLEGGLLLVLFNFSGAMEDAVSKKAMGALHNLHKLSPTRATVIDAEGNTYEKSVKEVSVGTHVLIRAGEIIPLDGTVVRGNSLVNLVHLTGESIPVSKGPQDPVQAGAMNLDGTLTVAVEKTSSESTLSRIITLIRQAQEMKPRLQRFLDRFSKTYATSIISLSFAFALSLPWIFHITYIGPEGSIYRALTFLIAASPCALIIATPTAYLSAISACARSGVLMKGGITLDALAQCSAIAFDKTGTLTTGELECSRFSKVVGETPLSEKEALAIAAALERHVTHPIGIAICEKGKKEGISPIEVHSFTNVPGFGLEGEASLHGKTYTAFIGNGAFITQKKQLDLPLSDATSTYLLIEDAVYVFEFSDTIRPQMKEIVEELSSKLGVKTVMLTGDHEKSAKYVAAQTGIQEVHADLRPEQKLEIVEKMNESGHLAMIGDGINDAPALARATVGISLGQIGSATAIDASDIVLLKDTMTLLPWLVRKAKKTTSIIRQNLTLALAVICLATTPALLGLIPLWLAVILHEGGTVIVGLNSLRLLRKHKVS